MKKSYFRIFSWMNCLIQSLSLLCSVLFGCFGMFIEWTSAAYPVLAVLSAAVMLAFSVKNRDRQAEIGVLLSLPPGIINAVLLNLVCRANGSLICGVLIVILSIAAFVFGKGRKAARIVTGIVSALLTAVFVIVMLFAVFLGDFGKTTVVKHLPSPDGKWIAEVIDDDQGALGGDTLIRVYRKTFLDGICRTGKNAFVGDWGLAEMLNPEWTAENTLLIDGKSVEF